MFLTISPDDDILTVLLLFDVLRNKGKPINSYSVLAFVMQNKLFVGNLAWGTDDQALQDAFSPYGQITSAHVVTDRETSRSRGFGFVEFADDASAKAAMDALEGSDLDGRTIHVSVARPPKERE